MSWKPISEDRILGLVNESRKRMNPLERRFWDAIAIYPEKWKQSPYGKIGNGFWVVALIGKVTVWYNDIEDGFNRSNYSDYGTIPDNEYWCNQDKLELQVKQIMDMAATGRDSAGRFGPPRPGEYPGS
jgi:hypothetical protein